MRGNALSAAAAALAAAICFAPGASGAGELAYVTRTEMIRADAFGRQTKTEYGQRISLRPDVFRSERLDTGRVTIVLLAERRMAEIDKAGRLVRSVTFDEMRRAVGAHLKLLEARLADRSVRLSHSQRRRLLGILGKRRVRVTVERSKETVQMLGRECTKVTYSEDGIKRIEEWVTARIDRCVDMTPLMELTGEFSRELLRAKRRQKGFALKSIVHGRLAISPLRTTNTVASLRAGPLDDALFKVPEATSEPGEGGEGGEGPGGAGGPGGGAPDVSPREPEPEIGADH